MPFGKVGSTNMDRAPAIESNVRRPHLRRSHFMKVVLFCGGLGTRLRDYDENMPKPMVSIGYRPIMWHLMRYYAHFGHKDFILCLGYKADVIKRYFIDYEECLSNDFVMTGGQDVQLLNSDIHDWRITSVSESKIDEVIE